MEMINECFAWLFGTRAGVLTLMAGGVLLFLILAWLLEKRTRMKYYNHEKSDDDWDLFGDE